MPSSVSTYFQRSDTLRWTSYLDDCLHELEDAKEYSTDTRLVYLVRVQLIVERAVQAPWHDSGFDSDETVRAPVQFHVITLQERLRDLKNGIPADLTWDGKSRIRYGSWKLLTYYIRHFIISYLQRRSVYP